MDPAAAGLGALESDQVMMTLLQQLAAQNQQAAAAEAVRQPEACSQGGQPDAAGAAPAPSTSATEAQLDAQISELLALKAVLLQQRAVGCQQATPTDLAGLGRLGVDQAVASQAPSLAALRTPSGPLLGCHAGPSPAASPTALMAAAPQLGRHSIDVGCLLRPGQGSSMASSSFGSFGGLSQQQQLQQQNSQGPQLSPASSFNGQLPGAPSPQPSFGLGQAPPSPPLLLGSPELGPQELGLPGMDELSFQRMLPPAPGFDAAAHAQAQAQQLLEQQQQQQQLLLEAALLDQAQLGGSHGGIVLRPPASCDGCGPDLAFMGASWQGSSSSSVGGAMLPARESLHLPRAPRGDARAQQLGEAGRAYVRPNGGRFSLDVHAMALMPSAGLRSLSGPVPPGQLAPSLGCAWQQPLPGPQLAPQGAAAAQRRMSLQLPGPASGYVSSSPQLSGWAAPAGSAAGYGIQSNLFQPAVLPPNLAAVSNADSSAPRGRSPSCAKSQPRGSCSGSPAPPRWAGGGWDPKAGVAAGSPAARGTGVFIPGSQRPASAKS